MSTPEDREDRRFALRAVLLILAVLLAAALLFIFLLGPLLADIVAPGLGLKESAVIAFGVTLAVLVLLALAAGEGLLGEIQYMLAAFGGFFFLCWLMIAWIF